MNIGKGKLIAGFGSILVAIVAIVAWNVWGTDGLLAVTLGVLLATAVALAWLVTQSQRQMRSLLAATRSAIVDSVAPNEGSEQLLRAVQAGFVRSDHVLDTLVTEWREAKEDLFSEVGAKVDHDLEPRADESLHGLLLSLHEIVTERRPNVVVECGSGTATVVIARAIRDNGAGKLFSLEHDEARKEAVERELASHGLGDHAEILNAPLRPVEIDGKEWRWYATDLLPPGEIDVLVAHESQPGGLEAGRLAFVAFGERLSPDALVLLNGSRQNDHDDPAAG